MEMIDKVRALFPRSQGEEEKIVKVIQKFFTKVDAKKQGTFIGKKLSLNFEKLTQEAIFPKHTHTEDEVIDYIIQLYEGIQLWSHPQVQVNVVPPPTTISIATEALTARYNEDPMWDKYGRGAAQSEAIAIGMLADLIGFDKKTAGGVFTFGGTGTNLYAARIGIEKADPDAKDTGIRDRIHFFCSDVSHYSIKTTAIWTGVGLNNVKIIPSDDNNVMDIGKLEVALNKTIRDGVRIGTIFATMGTTDAFGIDPLKEIVKLRNKIQNKVDYRIHVHADAVIGWPYLTFSGDTSIQHLPHPLREEIMNIVSKITELHYADSVGIDFHKTGWTPFVCSVFMANNIQDLNLLQRAKKDMPYLYHGHGYQPGKFTLETTRPNYAQKALANIMALGKEGYEALVVQLLTVADYLRKKIEESEDIALLNSHNPAFVTDFRIYSETKHTEKGGALFEQELHDISSEEFTKNVNEYNRRIAQRITEEAEQKGTSLLSYTESYKTTNRGRELVALKSYPMSPFTDKEHMDVLLKDLCAAKAYVNYINGCGRYL